MPTTGTKAAETLVPKHSEFLGDAFSDSEIVIGLVGAVGTELNKITSIVEDRLKTYKYTTSIIKVSKDVIPKVVDSVTYPDGSEYERFKTLMDKGNEARKTSKDNSILALGAAAKIAEGRPKGDQATAPYKKRHAYIINSLKHPEEVERLRSIYPEGFYLLGVFSEKQKRSDYLVQDKNIPAAQAEILMDRDEDEHLKYGQRTSDTFHLSDFFIHIDGDPYKMKKSVWRILDIMFGHYFKTPTFDEFAMFMAFSASLRSADLSRQVGAVIAKGNQILATGANDCPKSGGGLYWPEYNDTEHDVIDDENGRDYKRGEDSNSKEKEKILANLMKELKEIGVDKPPEELREAIKKSKIKDITEYGRVVHAEMEAVLSCARNNISCKDATLYCTTFPCHNCAKHIIAAGIKDVVYVEPYPKSKAPEFHDDSILLGFHEDQGKHVRFRPFVGVGPRRFFDLFSMNLGSGYSMTRKDDTGKARDWSAEESKLRIQMLPCSYVDLEVAAAHIFDKFKQHTELLKSQKEVQGQ